MIRLQFSTLRYVMIAVITTLLFGCQTMKKVGKVIMDPSIQVGDTSQNPSEMRLSLLADEDVNSSYSDKPRPLEIQVIFLKEDSKLLALDIDEVTAENLEKKLGKNYIDHQEYTLLPGQFKPLADVVLEEGTNFIAVVGFFADSNVSQWKKTIAVDPLGNKYKLLVHARAHDIDIRSADDRANEVQASEDVRSDYATKSEEGLTDDEIREEGWTESDSAENAELENETEIETETEVDSTSEIIEQVETEDVQELTEPNYAKIPDDSKYSSYNTNLVGEQHVDTHYLAINKGGTVLPVVINDTRSVLEGCIVAPSVIPFVFLKGNKIYNHPDSMIDVVNNYSLVEEEKPAQTLAKKYSNQHN